MKTEEEKKKRRVGFQICESHLQREKGKKNTMRESFDDLPLRTGEKNKINELERFSDEREEKEGGNDPLGEGGKKAKRPCLHGA